MIKKIRIGIAGFGRSGCDIHGRWLNLDRSRFEVVAVADCLEANRAEARTLFQCETVETYQELLARGDFDLFVNATPSKFHFDAALAALNAGYHVLQEKPSSPTVAKFDELAAAAKKANKVLYPFQNSRFYPFFTKIMEVVNSKILGEIINIRINWSGFSRRWDWQTRQDMLGGNLFNTGPHLLDHAILLFGEAYPQVFCRMAAKYNDWNIPGDANNFCALTLYKEGHPTIEVVMNSFQAYPQGDMYNIGGTRGGLTASAERVKWKYFNPADAPKQQLWQPWSKARGYCSEQLPWIEESWEHKNDNSNAAGYNEIVEALYNNLYDVIAHGAKQIIQLDQVRRQVYVLEEAHRQNVLPMVELEK
jgi:predicted dehydrogenase